MLTQFIKQYIILDNIKKSGFFKNTHNQKEKLIDKNELFKPF